MNTPRSTLRRAGTRIRARAPGRVNLIGEHTDYSGGLVMPMAIDLETVIDAVVTGGDVMGGDVTDGDAVGGDVVLTTDADPEPLHLDLPVEDPASVRPTWGRYVAAVAHLLRARQGLRGTITSTLPAGSGLSSSAALEVATALALGAQGSVREIASLCQAAESAASGVPCGIMDQLASTAGIADHALMIDCSTLEVTPVPVPLAAKVLVVHSGEHRRLEGSEYATRREECELAAEEIGPLRLAELSDVETIADPLRRGRARHVVSENIRVREAARALAEGDLDRVGEAMGHSHASLRDDFEVSTPTLDALVEHLGGLHGVRGARLTGAGFGGCVVALCDAEADPVGESDELQRLDSWVVRPADGASVHVVDS